MFLESLSSHQSLPSTLARDRQDPRVCILRSCLKIIHDFIIQSLAKPTAPEFLSEENEEQISGDFTTNPAANVERKR